MSLAKRSEKGLLTPDNSVVALIDYQPQMLFGVTSIDRQSVLVQLSLVLAASRASGGNLLREAAVLYKVDFDAITLKVKHEFAAKDKAKAIKKTPAKAAAAKPKKVA